MQAVGQISTSRVAMFWSYLLAVAASAPYAAAQNGADQDAPMLRGGAGPGRGAMLRFGCSQVVIERLDPWVNQPSFKRSI